MDVNIELEKLVWNEYNVGNCLFDAISYLLKCYRQKLNFE